MQRSLCRILLGVLLAWGTTEVIAATENGIAHVDSRFQDAEAALTRGDRQAFRQFTDQLVDHPLHPYLVYADLKLRVDTLKPDELKHFLNQHQDTPLAWQLRKRWLAHQARRGRWQDFLDHYTPTSDTTLQCQQAQALLATGRTHEAMLRAEALWLHGRSRPKACDRVFDRWIQAGNLSPALAWKRIELAMAQNQTRLARFLRRYLPKAEQRQLDRWLNLHSKPERIAEEQPTSRPDTRRLQMQVHALDRLADRDALAALAHWQRLSGQPYSQAQIHRVELALTAALLDASSNAAYDYIRSLTPRSGDHVLQELRLRAALVRQDWSSYLDWHAQLPPAIRDRARWRYWQARALAAKGSHSDALAVYTELAGERGYHGFLAADRLGKPYAIEHSEAHVDAHLLDELQQRPALERARLLLALDRQLDARREWQWGTRDLGQDALVAAAKLAEDWGWHSQAILTIAQGEYWDDLDLRFPLAHRTSVEDQAARQSIDPAWIYAVVRQESAFQADARSRVGASGLMQLMPATARRVARKLPNKPRIDGKSLNEPALNITLGSAYLREVLDRLYNNRVLATAAYNAGPHRVQRWLPTQNVAADLWIESIPFRETRRYLQRVLGYTAIYQARMGRQPERLLDQMPDIRPAMDYLQASARQARSS